jgi:diguanylate cyclase (GGDEF)-like protein/putative nucleotidyltransferase with HDIG domain
MRAGNNYYTKLFLVIMAAVIISSILISGILITGNVNNIEAITENGLRSSSEQKVTTYDINIMQLHALSKSIANDTAIKDYFQKLSRGQEDRKFYQDLRIDLEEEMKAYSGVLENAFFILDGIVYVDGIGGTSVGHDSSESEWYINVQNSREHYLGKLKESPITGLSVMVSAYPVLDDDGQLLSVFGLSINLNGFSDTVIGNPEHSGENTIIADGSGTVIAANETGLIYNYNIAAELPGLYQYIEKHREGITYYRKDGIPYIAAVIKSELGVTIIQSLPVSTYRDPMITSIIISVIILLAILGGVAIVAFSIAKNITKPIHILVEEFNQMAAGNYENELPEYLKKRKDEFAVLGNSLTEMKSQTSQLIMKLNLAYDEMEASLEEVVATEDELRKQNELLTLSEQRLKESNEYNRAIIDVLPDVIYILDREGRVTGSRESREMLPYVPKEAFLNKNLSDIVSGEIAAGLFDKIQAALDTGELQTFEYDREGEEGREIYEFRVVQCFEDKVMAIARNVTDQRLYQRQIEYLSFHDHLTGLRNRRFFEKELERLDEEAFFPLYVIMADVNGLKLINDSFGHRAGDQLLVKVANAMKAAYFDQDLIFRIGGDEFVILAPNWEREQAEELVRKVQANCDKEEVNAIKISVSFGWYTKRNKTEDINTVLKGAEDYMYKKKLYDGPSMRGKTIGIIINTLHEKNRREEQHSYRVAELCEKLADALKMPAHVQKEIRSAGLLHDIGKIAIPENLLNKPGKLTPEEFEEITKHPEIGYRILCSANEMTEIAEYVLCHHERWDGKGYPRRLKGESIPLQARMIAIADTYDAMTSLRSYRSPVSEEEAAKEILKNAGTQFDPELSKLFVQEVLGYRGGI